MPTPTHAPPPPLSHSQEEASNSYSSHFPLSPLPASLLLDRELARKEVLAGRGNPITTGCSELDDYVLLGGFERGSVVGVSAEGEEVGVLIGLQTVARLLATQSAARAVVVTTLPAAVLLPKLRGAIVGQLALAGLEGGMQDLESRVGGCLERVSIARVFDVEGLWEVLREVEEVVTAEDGPPKERATGRGEQRTEVLDSEDEGGLSSPEPPTPSPPQPDAPQNPTHNPTATQPPTTPPDMILITHTSTLLNALFTGRDKEAAHNTMLLLTSHLHALTRSPSHGSPLIMLLNSTTSPPIPHRGTDDGTAPATDGGYRPPPKQLDPTLRSIFNTPPPGPPPPAPQAMLNFASGARRNKPSFGLVFSQMLDLHLLCTRVPRTRADSSVLAASPGAADGVSYVWAVEVLLDEMGVYDERAGDGGCEWGVVVRRRCREQRWGVVDVDGEGRVVNAVV
ncbi:hypothetical protein C8A01DRAFT_14578 [Parachaetomium inaequale]|uniref:Uncharacterized protein n=1 Tax=Parachaetomium inaequale TaxID=2588326 RepID=A0AAN6STA0_9PEZI|nr:hypothetical protein C8A01DRAFT_14578 [Parachaetomium inaequale]